MTSSALAGHPFGTVITEETLKQTFAPLTQWEDKYRQLILLGKQLPALSDDLKAQAKEIAGCENRVWLGFSVSGEKLHFFGDSEGRIVRGLLAVLLTAIEGKSAATLLAHSPLALFDELGLRAQLSASRGQGLVALSEAVQDAARQAIGKGMHEVEVKVQGAGAGRESAVRAIQSAGIHVTLIKDCTPIPHNGCRPRKRRRV